VTTGSTRVLSQSIRRIPTHPPYTFHLLVQRGNYRGLIHLCTQVAATLTLRCLHSQGASLSLSTFALSRIVLLMKFDGLSREYASRPRVGKRSGRWVRNMLNMHACVRTSLSARRHKYWQGLVSVGLHAFGLFWYSGLVYWFFHSLLHIINSFSFLLPQYFFSVVLLRC